MAAGDQPGCFFWFWMGLDFLLEGTPWAAVALGVLLVLGAGYMASKASV
ncbi:MAG: hypothetical protein LBG90_03315 [Spirochaetaceae bacterium]|nr:hypothetical protein [Spirochaetaceae bacterium]